MMKNLHRRNQFVSSLASDHPVNLLNQHGYNLGDLVTINVDDDSVGMIVDCETNARYMMWNEELGQLKPSMNVKLLINDRVTTINLGFINGRVQSC